MELDVQVRISPEDIYLLGMKMLRDEDARYACGDLRLSYRGWMRIQKWTALV